MDHLAVADVHADVVDRSRAGREEQQVTGLEVRRGDGLAGLRLFARVARQVDAVGLEDRVGETGAVESVGGDSCPQVAQAVELLRGLHEVFAAGLLGFVADVKDIHIVDVDPGGSATGECHADVVDVLCDERQVDVEADVGTGVLGELDAFELALGLRDHCARLVLTQVPEAVVLDKLLLGHPSWVALFVLRGLLVGHCDLGPAALDVEDGDFRTVGRLGLSFASQPTAHIGGFEVLVPLLEVDGVLERRLIDLARSLRVGPQRRYRDIDVGGFALFDLAVGDSFEFLAGNDIS